MLKIEPGKLYRVKKWKWVNLVDFDVILEGHYDSCILEEGTIVLAISEMCRLRRRGEQHVYWTCKLLVEDRVWYWSYWDNTRNKYEDCMGHFKSTFELLKNPKQRLG